MTDNRFDCVECEVAICAMGPALVEACASVGIERGKSTGEMFDIWHEREHRSHTADDR